MQKPLILWLLAASVVLATCGTGVNGDSGQAGSTPPSQSTSPSTGPVTTGPVTTGPVATVTTTQPAGSVAPDGQGVVTVRLEAVGGIFIEGFEIGLRFETSDGEVIASTLWSDFVQSQASQDIDAFYTSVLEQEVPAGEVVVLATVNVGMGPGPVVPDLDGDLKCKLKVEVAEGGRVDVEVSFSGSDDCLRQL